MSEWGSGMTVDRKEPPKIRTRALDPLGSLGLGSVSMAPRFCYVHINNQNSFSVLPCIQHC